MAQELVIKIVGDATSLDRAMRKGARSAKNFDRSLRGTTLSVRGFHRSVTGLAAGLLGGAGLVVGLRAVAHETSEMQKVAAQTNAVIKSTGGVAGVSAEHVEELGKSLMNLSGIDDEVIKSGANLLLTFRNIRNVAGEGNDVFDQAILAALNLSTTFGRDLTGTAVMLGKALQEPLTGLTALRRSGVQFSESQTKLIKALVKSGQLLEAQKVILAEVQKQTEGSAEAYGNTLAGSLNKARENVLNLAGAMATTLLPVLEPLVDQAVKWLQNTQNQKQAMSDFRGAAEALGDVLSVLRDAFSALNDITGSTRETVKLLLGALLAFKAVQILNTLGLIGTSMGAIGTQAEAARGKVSLLRAQLGLLAAPIVVTIVIELILHKNQIDKFFEDKGLGFLNKSLLQHLQDLREKVVPRGIARHRLPFTEEESIEFPLTPEPFLGHTARAREAARRGARRPGEEPPPDPDAAKRVRASREALRQLRLERAAFAVEQASATASLADDLAALNKYNALLARRIRGGHATLELEREQFQVQQQIADVLKQQAEKRAEQREARQFRALGLGPGGADLVPSAEVLRKQLGSAEKALQGTFLDTKKTRSLVAQIRKVLSGAMGAISEDVRSTIKRLIDDLRQMQEKASVDVTRFQKTARGQFALAGAAGGGRGVVITGGVHLHGIQNVQQLEAALAKRKKQRARQRGSTR